LHREDGEAHEDHEETKGSFFAIFVMASCSGGAASQWMQHISAVMLPAFVILRPAGETLISQTHRGHGFITKVAKLTKITKRSA
jgi:hypothetical protein